MRKIVEISASFSGKIPTGSYENMSPYYAVKEIYEIEIEAPTEAYSDVELVRRLRNLHDLCYSQFKRDADVAYSERIASQYKNIRFYDGQDGKKYPSVTSIIGWDEDFHISPEELQQYASRGTIIDKQVEIFLQTGVWNAPEEIPAIYPDLVIIKRGSLGLVVDDVNFVEFYKQYPFKVISLQGVLLNHQHQYGGRYDIKCTIESSNKGKWEKIEGIKYDVPTILDVKATGGVDKAKFFKQQTAYAKCDEEVQQVGIIHLNKENKCGYSQPLIEANMDKYWSLFLADREKFRQRYGI